MFCSHMFVAPIPYKSLGSFAFLEYLVKCFILFESVEESVFCVYLVSNREALQNISSVMQKYNLQNQ